ncbi:phage holin family protein [Effusibacillus dendaii]|uniref:Membrane protein n=1 Tax=Effusibacillus dendaii TaxID=2743772 RepID=A0A7I8DD25_9BACL|nr:phage holin family protein [Effusibacillus dendaii]BCJ88098.1 membrane protein [Effusibacillus dendaii]
MNILGTIVRFVVSALVLMFVGFLVPGFGGLTFLTALLAAVVIAVLGWAVERLFGERRSPYARGISGFISSAIVIYIAQWFIPGMRVTILGALLASLIIGIIDLFVPGDVVRGQGFGDRPRND